MERSAASRKTAADRRERGVLLGSGFVGGEGLLGVLIATMAFRTGERPAGIGHDWMGPDWVVTLAGTAVFAFFLAAFARGVRK